jgi:hypothetical protein
MHGAIDLVPISLVTHILPSVWYKTWREEEMKEAAFDGLFKLITT